MHYVFTAPRYHTNQHFAIKTLMDVGHRVSFLALRQGGSEVYDALQPTVLGDSVLTRGFPHGCLSLPPVTRFISLMRSLAPDVTVVRNPISSFGLLAAATARLMDSKVVFYSQTPVHRRLRWWQKIARAILAWAADAGWISPVLGDPKSHPTALAALRYTPFVMEPLTCPSERRWLRNSAVNVLCVARFMERQNHRLFLQAIARLPENRQVRAAIVGECHGERAERLLAKVRGHSRELGLEQRVCFKTNLPYWDVHREYVVHDLFVLPSRNEPAAVSHLEAMAHSLPVVCSDSNGTRCYIEADENVKVFRTDDLDGLVTCLERLTANRAGLVEMGARSYDLMVSRHSPEAYARQMAVLAGGDI